MIFIVIIGGQGRVWGSVLGAILFFALRTLFADFGALYLILLGMIAITLMVASPGGLSGLAELAKTRIQQNRTTRREGSNDVAPH